MNRTHAIIALLGSLLLLLAACGGGVDAQSEPQATAGGGIGGSGKGTVTAYGSVIVNDIREFEITPFTKVLLNGTPIDEAELRAQDAGLSLTTGRVATFTLAQDADAELTRGTALTLNVEHQIVGPVTSESPFEVLNQRVVVRAGTVLVGDNPLGRGHVVGVSGFANPENVVQASRVERPDPRPDAWKLVGPVDSILDGGLISVGNATNYQLVDILGVVPTACDGGLQVGALVQVTAEPFFGGNGALIATGLHCLPAGLQLPPGSAAVMPVSLEGLVGWVDPLDPSRFTLNGQMVLATADTQYFGGDATDIILGTQIEVQGTLDKATGVLLARKVRFMLANVTIRAPLYRERINEGVSIRLIGLTIYATELTKDIHGFLQMQQPDSQVNMRGYEFGGALYANQITRQGGPGNPDNNDVWLRGPVESISAFAGRFTIQGVRVDANSAAQRLVQYGTELLTVEQFLGLLHVGIDASIVQVEGSTYDSENRTLRYADVIRFIK